MQLSPTKPNTIFVLNTITLNPVNYIAGRTECPQLRLDKEAMAAVIEQKLKSSVEVVVHRAAIECLQQIPRKLRNYMVDGIGNLLIEIGRGHISGNMPNVIKNMNAIVKLLNADGTSEDTAKELTSIFSHVILTDTKLGVMAFLVGEICHSFITTDVVELPFNRDEAARELFAKLFQMPRIVFIEPYLDFVDTLEKNEAVRDWFVGKHQKWLKQAERSYARRTFSCWKLACSTFITFNILKKGDEESMNLFDRNRLIESTLQLGATYTTSHAEELIRICKVVI